MSEQIRAAVRAGERVVRANSSSGPGGAHPAHEHRRRDAGDRGAGGGPPGGDAAWRRGNAAADHGVPGVDARPRRVALLEPHARDDRTIVQLLREHGLR